MKVRPHRLPARLAFWFLLAMVFSISSILFAAEVDTPTGKKLPGRIVGEDEETYKVETELPSGGRIILNIRKDQVDPDKPSPGRGRIDDVTGDVEIKRAGKTRFAAARKNMLVRPGDEIRTGSNSKAAVSLENTAVSGLDANTRFTVDKIAADPETKSMQIKVGLPAGKLWCEVGKLKTGDSKFEIETPSAVTGVRGTVFRVSVEQATSQSMVSVLSGEVRVSSKDVEAPEVVLTEDKAIVVEKGKEPRKLTATELLRHLKEIVGEWLEQSKYFESVTALAGIGQIEKIELQPGIPEPTRQLIYDRIQTSWQKASEDFYEIDKALKIFYLDFARFPTVEEGGLNALFSNPGTPQWNGPYIEEQYIRDSFDQPYNYAVKRDIDNRGYVEITTNGYDKVPGTSDDRKTIITEEDARRWEDRKEYN